MTKETIGLVDEFILNPELDSLAAIDAINYRLERLETLTFFMQSDEYEQIPRIQVAGMSFLISQQVKELKVLIDHYDTLERQSKIKAA